MIYRYYEIRLEDTVQLYSPAAERWVKFYSGQAFGLGRDGFSLYNVNARDCDDPYRVAVDPTDARAKLEKWVTVNLVTVFECKPVDALPQPEIN